MKLKYSGDRFHRYYLDGVQCKGVTTIAKIPDDTYRLDKWGKRMVALGMALDGGPLTERAIAHFDDRGELDDVAEEALHAAKAHEAAARGTAIHRTLERHDLGEEIIETPKNKALRTAYDRALEAAGLVVVPEYVERVVAHPKQMVAGRFDRLLKRRRDGKFVIADVKSGTRAVQYPHAIAVQLACYANAPLMAAQIPRSGGETETFEKLPEKLDLRWGYIIHTPSPDKVEVVKVDIAAGWDIAQKAIFPILKWRSRHDLIKPVGSTAVADVSAPAAEERVDWIKGRLALITMIEDADRARALVAELWPPNVPTPKKLTAGATWTDLDVDLLDDALGEVEKRFSVSFPLRDPAYSDMDAA